MIIDSNLDDMSEIPLAVEAVEALCAAAGHMIKTFDRFGRTASVVTDCPMFFFSMPIRNSYRPSQGSFNDTMTVQLNCIFRITNP